MVVKEIASQISYDLEIMKISFFNRKKMINTINLYRMQIL